MVPKGAQAPTPRIQRNLITCSVIWKGDPITAVKKIGKNSCKLCDREIMAMVKTKFKSPRGLINSRSELHGACRHIRRFHRLTMKTTPSADERKKRKKVDLNSPPRLTRRRLDPCIQTLDLDGNEFKRFHSQAGIDSSEFIHIYCTCSMRICMGQ
jgi:hypothetical protein